ncbi:hypothetical protein [Sediminitomix flava]|uniref:ABC-2 type transport system permease protein n=1 Tax=Sediminitomix flava TaxID=379075 RepID=A0A315Z996_SEDFL|nr:hypothetical protein [Sediminitomix flava]PWJ41970.1 hypothetical protein BC781_103220 [Sediminitomix flava]
MFKSFKNSSIIITSMVKYNLKIIFSSFFTYFLIVAFLVLALIVGIAIADSEGFNFAIDLMYGWLLFPGMLLVFYPTTFGIQNDKDANILEVIFSIPNYRYKVWLVRLVMVFIISIAILALFDSLLSVLIFPHEISKVVLQLCFPVIFFGSIGFVFSTMIKTGSGAAVVTILVTIALMILSGAAEGTKWDFFLNPFDQPYQVTNTALWEDIIFYNRIYMLVASVAMILYAMMRLQKREAFNS